MSTDRPRLLDLFCKAGGAATGWHRAGFDVLGVDIRPQPHYPFAFVQADAMTYPLHGFAAITGSPPCQRFTRGRGLLAGRQVVERPDLLTPTLARLHAHYLATGVPYVVENVPGAPVPNAVTMCGSAFGLAVRRHRLFGSPLLLLGAPCRHPEQGRPVGVYHRMADQVPQGGRTARTLLEAQAAMGIDWMTWAELVEAIPPAYTEHLGHQLLAHLESSRGPGPGRVKAGAGTVIL